ncbi:STAS domain-containing protein [Paraconexibacter antarcticus]|uniref:STAS domain-containing protein n=1 Tax=Paraconexibacter antarcticus TaxID=2949664 RepID=A0ABY5DS88_9ACTN|nr:STAS domain-containing protein [Paraconexibacter antarcticus]UTI63779.1 STAS domain-containing protein [Paraconexibacter antarcticus]
MIPAPFTITVTQQGGVSVLHVAGELDLSTVPELRSAFAAVDDPVLFDLRDCTFMDCTGAAAVLGCRWRHPIAIVTRPGSEPRKVLDVIAPPHLRGYDTAADGLAALGERRLTEEPLSSA